ncbi:hypothetical protein EDC04DRAFT_2849391, partial [Pisolithus marmoratus]
MAGLMQSISIMASALASTVKTILLSARQSASCVCNIELFASMLPSYGQQGLPSIAQGAFLTDPIWQRLLHCLVGTV